jgi:hypothetical protein
VKYILRIHGAGSCPELALDINEFESLKRSREILATGLAMEEKYEILILNYVEFEKELLGFAALSMIRNPYAYEYEDLFQVRTEFNRRMVNMLTAARMYVEQLYQPVKAALPERANVKQEIKSFFSKEYDECFEYRFMEALRNYVQHRGTPVHGTEFNHSRKDSEEGARFMISMEISLDKKTLQKDSVFKKKILDETPDKVDLKIATRKYVEGISRVHSRARKLVEHSLEQSRAVIENARAAYQKVYTEGLTGLSAICVDEDGMWDSTVPLLLDWDDVRVQLIRRNLELVNLSKRYVSSEIRIRNK